MNADTFRLVIAVAAIIVIGAFAAAAIWAAILRRRYAEEFEERRANMERGVGPAEGRFRLNEEERP